MFGPSIWALSGGETYNCDEEALCFVSLRTCDGALIAPDLIAPEVVLTDGSPWCEHPHGFVFCDRQ